MMKWLAILVLVVATPCFPAVAIEVRSATEIEVLRLIQGCWKREITPEEIVQKRKDNIDGHSEICFSSGGVVDMSTSGGNAKYGVEGFGADGIFRVINEKLIFDAARTESEGWIIGRAHVECDMIVRPVAALKLMNCVGSGPYPSGAKQASERLPDTSYEWLGLKQ